MKRKHRSPKERFRIFKLRDGICHLCGGQIAKDEAWEIEHEIPLEISRDDSDRNLRLAHSKCHKVKTSQDRKDIGKVHRQEARDNGSKRPKGAFQKREKEAKPERRPRLPPKQLYAENK